MTKRRFGPRRDLVAIALVGVAFLIAWQAIVVVGSYPRFLLPTPGDVFGRLATAIRDGVIWPHFVTTLTEVVLGLAVGVSAGMLTGFVLARWHLAERLLSPYIVAAQATPILALAPLIVMWFGNGLLSKVLICALICYFPMVVATTVGLGSIDPKLLELGRSLRATRRQLLQTIELPAALPTILGGLRISTTLAVVGAIVAEWAGASSGLGVLINMARGAMFDTPLMFATLFVIAAIGVVLYLAVLLLERRLVGDRA
jgi:NitT/TauT family transport system permease protein